MFERLAKLGFGLAYLACLSACGQNTTCIGVSGSFNCPASGSSSSSSGGSSSGSSSGGPGTAYNGFVNPATIQLGTTTMVGVQITNSGATVETGISTSVLFSSRISINAGPSYSCTPGTVATTAPDSEVTEIALSNATVPASSNCSFGATVTPPARGQYTITAAGQQLILTVQ